ncbi:MAG: hypothetical protein A2V93_02665 [Ignavibacteria bacterium RBG_16_34_14]|nr:MAG: hypothetical protein A2V93_02665 [Ignavibacteria bacterium RBG_16_34_14]
MAREKIISSGGENKLIYILNTSIITIWSFLYSITFQTFGQSNESSNLITISDTIDIKPGDIWFETNISFSKSKSTGCTRVIINCLDYPTSNQKLTSENSIGDTVIWVSVNFGDGFDTIRLSSEGSNEIIWVSVNGAGFIIQIDDLDPMVFNIGAEHVYSTYLYKSIEEDSFTTDICNGITPKTDIEYNNGRLANISMTGVMDNGKMFVLNYFKNYFIQSDPNYPLSFVIDSEGNYRYLCGRGILINKNVMDKIRSETLFNDTTSSLKSRAKIIRFDNNPSVYTWFNLLEHSNNFIKRGAIQALGWLTDVAQDSIVNALINILNNNSYSSIIHRDVAEALGRIGSPLAKISLEQATLSNEDWTKRVALESLEKIKERIK